MQKGPYIQIKSVPKLALIAKKQNRPAASARSRFPDPQRKPHAFRGVGARVRIMIADQLPAGLKRTALLRAAVCARTGRDSSSLWDIPWQAADARILSNASC